MMMKLDFSFLSFKLNNIYLTIFFHFFLFSILYIVFFSFVALWDNSAFCQYYKLNYNMLIPIVGSLKTFPFILWDWWRKMRRRAQCRDHQLSAFHLVALQRDIHLENWRDGRKELHHLRKNHKLRGAHPRGLAIS